MRCLRNPALITLLAIISVSVVSLYLHSQVHASSVQGIVQTEAPPPSPTPVPDAASSGVQANTNLSIADEVCLSCHGVPGETLTLPSGEVWDLYVAPELHQNSIHGQLGYACVQCHTDVGEYPHPPFEAADLREVTLKLNDVCARCHIQQYLQEQDGVHAAARQSGIREAAVCADCHTAHEVRQLRDPDTRALMPDARIWIPERCALCHNAIFQKYRESVHGSALIDGNPDVPTCIDCHGVHNIEDPRTTFFRLRSPELCAKCHTDPSIMNKYGLSTEVLNTYVADFHGTTVVIFERQSPDAAVNAPVCYDCHGVHDISQTGDPESGLQMQANLLARCQLCHPDASTNFPTAWMSHYIPSPENYPLVYYINLFYKFFIPFTLGGMTLLVLMDTGRRWINRFRWKEQLKERSKAELEAEPSVSLSDAKMKSEASSLSVDIEDQTQVEPDLRTEGIVPPDESPDTELASTPLEERTIESISPEEREAQIAEPETDKDLPDPFESERGSADTPELTPLEKAQDDGDRAEHRAPPESDKDPKLSDQEDQDPHG